MLRSLHIISLFGIYTYNIDLTDSQGRGVKFITSPNGYGKTTLLSLIHAFYSKDWAFFLRIPFQEVTFNFDDSSIRISQHKSNEEEENSDEEPETNKYIEIRTSPFSKNDVFKYGIVKGENGLEHYGIVGNSLQMYSSIQPCYFIHDNRLRKTNTSKLLPDSISTERATVVANAEDLENKLTETRNQISLMTTDLKFTSPIGRDEYRSVATELIEFNEKLVSYGLMEKVVITDYREDNALYLGAVVTAFSEMKKKVAPFIQKLDLFKDIITRSDFAYKRMEIHPRYGYRFIAENKNRAILQSDSLSSGEQHLLIMAYELLFVAPDESLILLDEPELSFYFLWQSNFLKNLQDIHALRPQLQWIVCTHSPQIFGRKWDLSVDLYELQQHSILA